MNASTGVRWPRFELDHLVVAASSLAAGRRWCEATFGVAAETGGRHATMATHNVLLSLASTRFPKAYLEIIAIDPDAARPPHRRWFDLDSAALQAAIASTPALVHWVARADDIDAAHAALRAAGHDPGVVTALQRQAPRGLLRWRITVPVDGRRPAGGAVPLLIAWGEEHPTDTLPASGVTIESLRLGGIAESLAACFAMADRGVEASPLTAALSGPRGPVTLASPQVAA